MIESTKPIPKNPVLWVYRDVRGTKEQLIEAVKASPVAEHRKAYLIAEIGLLEGGSFRLDSMAMSEHAGEFGAHLHIAKLF